MRRLFGAPLRPVLPLSVEGAQVLTRRARSAVVRQQCAQAGVLLAARRASVQVCPHTGNRRIGICAGELQLDIVVELLEALLAAQLGARWPEQTLQECFDGCVRWLGHRFPPLAPKPREKPSAATVRRRCERASWIVLYSAPRVVPSRSARTSIGTPLRATATSTSR